MAKSLVLFLGVLILLFGLSSLKAQATYPPLAVHPLPVSLGQWQDVSESGDYLENLEPTPVGALLWSDFPVKVYWQQPSQLDSSAASQRWQEWLTAVARAVAEWNVYLPLTRVDQAEGADIIIERSPPPLGVQFNPATGKIEIPRARTAQTRYQLYFTETTPPLLRHRMTIQISPRLSDSLLLSASRHELGHALGIWGHSPRETDALFFSQVRESPPISVRDVNTLKKVYQQPTRLGWAN